MPASSRLKEAVTLLGGASSTGVMRVRTMVTLLDGDPAPSFGRFLRDLDETLGHPLVGRCFGRASRRRSWRLRIRAKQQTGRDKHPER
jgi:hypothetical protein